MNDRLCWIKSVERCPVLIYAQFSTIPPRPEVTCRTDEVSENFVMSIFLLFLIKSILVFISLFENIIYIYTIIVIDSIETSICFELPINVWRQ